MSIEAWLTLTGILVTLALAFLTLVVGIVGWFLQRTLGAIEEDIKQLQVKEERLSQKAAVVETILVERGLLPRVHKFPSPSSQGETG